MAPASNVPRTERLRDFSVDARLLVLSAVALVVGSMGAGAVWLLLAERKTLLVAGAAAGMTAVFGTPIAAVLLAVELLLFEWRARSFIPVAVAAIVAAMWRPWF